MEKSEIQVSKESLSWKEKNDDYDEEEDEEMMKTKANEEWKWKAGSAYKWVPNLSWAQHKVNLSLNQKETFITHWNKVLFRQC